MSQANLKESFAAFVSYVKLFLFLGLIGATGFYFYNRNIAEKNARAAEEAAAAADKVKKLAASTSGAVSAVSGKPLKPSLTVHPVMQANLSRLAEEVKDGSRLEVDEGFIALEKQINSKKMEPGRQQASWNAASAVCKEIRRIASERAAISDSLQKTSQPVKSVSAVPVSKADTDERNRKTEFFVKSANQRWQTAVVERQKKVQSLYEQLVATEKLSANVWDAPVP